MTSKRKADEAARALATAEESASDAESTSSSFAPSAIDVSFNFVAPTEIDFQALKRLVQQLYYTHAPDLDLGALADHVIQIGGADSETALGTVVKVDDDEDADPFAFASVVDLRQKAESSSAATKALRGYYGRTLKKTDGARSSAQKISDAILQGNVLQIFHERMINMPPQIMPPLYRMLFDEIEAKEELKTATHLLFFSRVFSMQALDDETEEANGGGSSSILQGRASTGKSKAKRSKKTAPPTNAAITTAKAAEMDGKSVAATDAVDVGLFHPEDAIIAKYADQTYTYRFPGVKDSDESFNAPMYARVALVPRSADILKKLLLDLEEALAVDMADA